ncbi:MAG TPA: hypothetical protein ENG03_07010 [Thioploca sp.]|nr:MAG: hypothetical protein DRR19_03385 [Gammaproteobacteria bacterium]HDN26833.1 hypothetical protein [Thioploca sp.]
MVGNKNAHRKLPALCLDGQVNVLSSYMQNQYVSHKINNMYKEQLPKNCPPQSAVENDTVILYRIFDGNI